MSPTQSIRNRLLEDHLCLAQPLNLRFKGCYFFFQDLNLFVDRHCAIPLPMPSWNFPGLRLSYRADWVVQDRLFTPCIGNLLQGTYRFPCKCLVNQITAILITPFFCFSRKSNVVVSYAFYNCGFRNSPSQLDAPPLNQVFDAQLFDNSRIYLFQALIFFNSIQFTISVNLRFCGAD